LSQVEPAVRFPRRAPEPQTPTEVTVTPIWLARQAFVHVWPSLPQMMSRSVVQPQKEPSGRPHWQPSMMATPEHAAAQALG
jgi:hypothetical protein